MGSSELHEKAYDLRNTASLLEKRSQQLHYKANRLWVKAEKLRQDAADIDKEAERKRDEKKQFIFTIVIHGVGETKEKAYNDAQTKLKDRHYDESKFTVQSKESPNHICSHDLTLQILDTCEPLYEKPVKIPGEKLSDLTTEEIYKKLVRNDKTNLI